MMRNIFLFLIVLQAHFIVTASSMKVQWTRTNKELKAVGGEAKLMAGNVPAIRLNVTIRGNAGGNRFQPPYQPFVPSSIINCGCCFCVQSVCSCKCPPQCRHTTLYPPHSSQSINTTLPKSSTTSPKPHLSTPSSKRTQPSTTFSPFSPYSPNPQQLRCCLTLNVLCSICSCLQKCGFPYFNDGNSYLAGLAPDNYALLSNHDQYNPFLQQLLNKNKIQQSAEIDWAAKSKSMGIPEIMHESNNLIMSKKFPNGHDAFLTNIKISSKNENEQQSSPAIMESNVASNLNDKRPTAMVNYAKTNATTSDDENVNNIGSTASESSTLFSGTIVGLPAFTLAIFLHILI